MAFQSGHRRGQVWEDVQTLDTIIKNTRFNLTGKSEREFELAFMSAVAANKDRIKGDIHSQVDKDTVVRSVYLFGKKHRPDLTINEDGIAVEIKFLSNSLDGLKQAIGQSIFYRVRYRFVINLFVIDEKYKDTYLKGANDEEKDLEEICKDLSSDMNIVSYLVPAFNPGSNVITSPMERHQLVPISATNYSPGLLDLGTAGMDGRSVADVAGVDRISYEMGMFSPVALANRISRLLRNDFSSSRGEVTLIESVVVVVGIFLLLLIGFSIASTWWPVVTLTPSRVLGLALASPMILVAYIIIIIPFSR